MRAFSAAGATARLAGLDTSYVVSFLATFYVVLHPHGRELGDP